MESLRLNRVTRINFNWNACVVVAAQQTVSSKQTDVVISLERQQTCKPPVFILSCKVTCLFTGVFSGPALGECNRFPTMNSLLLRRGIAHSISKSLCSAARTGFLASTTTAPNFGRTRFASTTSSFRREDDFYEIREKPQSLSYFTGNYKYNDLLIELDGLYKQYEDWRGDLGPLPPPPTNLEEHLLAEMKANAGGGEGEEGTASTAAAAAAAAAAEGHSWKLCDKMSQMLGIPLKTSQWRKIVIHLNKLASLPKPLPEAVEKVLEPYRRVDAATLERQAGQKKTLDELGRAYAVGRRKESSARCWVVEGDGQVRVNGQTLEEYFQRSVDRDEVLLPLEATENRDRYNVWAIVEGGGSTGWVAYSFFCHKKL